MLNNWDLPRLRPLPRRVRVTEQHGEHCGCSCFRRGWEAGARAERERIEGEEIGAGLLARLLAWLALLLLAMLLTCWGGGGRS